MSLEEFSSELQTRFEEKRRVSRSYSIRAMASELGLPPSTLQKVFKGERKLGLRVARDLAPRFGVTILSGAKSPRRTKTDAYKFRPLDPDTPARVSWVNLAILELLKLPSFEPSPEWVAKKLGLPLSVVTELLNEMDQNQMVDRSGDRWIDLIEESSVHAERLLTTPVVREALKKIIAVSSEVIDDVPYERREHSFGLFPVAARDLPKLKKKLVELRWEFMTYAQNQKSTKDAVYALQLGFFPVTTELK